MKKIFLLVFIAFVIPVFCFAESIVKVKEFEGEDKEIKTVAFSSDGKFMASGGGNCRVKVWDVTSGTIVYNLEGHKECVNSVCFSPDGKFLVSGSNDDTIKLWDLSNGTLAKDFDLNYNVHSLDFYHNGKYIACVSEGGQPVRVYNVPDFSELRNIKVELGFGWGGMNPVRFSKEGKYIAALSIGFDRLFVWTLKDSALAFPLQANFTPKSISFSKDKQSMAVAGYKGWRDEKKYLDDKGKMQTAYIERADGFLMILTTADFTETASLELDQKSTQRMVVKINTAAFASTNDYVVVGDNNGDIYAVDVTGQSPRVIAVKREAHETAFLTGTNDVHDIAFSPDGKYFVSGGGNWQVNLMMWEIR